MGKTHMRKDPCVSVHTSDIGISILNRWFGASIEVGRGPRLSRRKAWGRWEVLYGDHGIQTSSRRPRDRIDAGNISACGHFRHRCIDYGDCLQRNFTWVVISYAFDCREFLPFVNFGAFSDELPRPSNTYSSYTNYQIFSHAKSMGSFLFSWGKWGEFLCSLYMWQPTLNEIWRQVLEPAASGWDLNRAAAHG